MKATFKDQIIAQSNNTIIIEGNHYFPPNSVNKQFLKESDHHTTCPWKGEASYYDVVVGDTTNQNAAWYYPNPKDAALQIKDHVAFWNGVEVSN